MSLSTEHINIVNKQQNKKISISFVEKSMIYQENIHVSTADHIFSRTFDEYVIAPELSVDLHEVPKKQKSLSGFSLLNIISSKHYLRKQLRFARSHEDIHHIDESVFKQILAHIGPQGFSLKYEKDRKKNETYALRILTYLAKHQADLPFKEAIEMLETKLKQELDSKDLAKHVDAEFERTDDTVKLFKHINYTMLALGYFIIQGQAIPSIEMTDYFIRGIELLSMLSPADYYYETLTVALTAKTKLPKAEALSSQELNIIQSALRPIYINQSAAGQSECAKQPYGNAHLFFTVGEKPPLRDMKQQLNKSQPLSKKQLSVMLKRTNAGRNHVKAKATQLIRLAIANGVDFPDKHKLIEVLTKQLKEDEFKLRANALVASKMLLEDKAFHEEITKLTNLDEFQYAIYTALRYRQEQALKALYNHLNMHFSQSLQEKDSWIALIDNLLEHTTSKDKALVSLAATVKSQLVGDFSADNIKHYINQAKNGEQLPQRIILGLEQDVGGELTTMNKAKLYKYWLILSYAAGNGQAISAETMKHAANQYIASESIDLQRLLLNVLAYSIKHHGDSVVTEKFFTKLLQCRDNPSLQASAYFFVDAWLSAQSHMTDQKQCLSLMEWIAEPLLNNHADDQLKEKMILIFGKASERGFVLTSIITLFITDELEKASNRSYLFLLIHLLAITLKNCAYQVFFTDAIVEKLINLSLLSNTHEAEDALELLLRYIPKAEQAISPIIIEKLVALHLSKPLQGATRRIIDMLLACDYALDPLMVAKLKQDELPQAYECVYHLESHCKTLEAQSKSLAVIQQQAHEVTQDRGIVPKSLAELMAELRTLNPSNFDRNPTLKKLIESDDISLLINAARRCYLKYRSKHLGPGFSAAPIIKDWTEQHIKSWATHFSSRYKLADLSDNRVLTEVLAVLIRSCELGDKKPREAQLLALLIVLRGKVDKRALFMQIDTGEGKSLLNTMLSMVDGLFGEVVDNETSSEVLAGRDAKDFSKCFDLWNITVASNEDTHHRTGTKDCYKKSVVYSDSHQLQFDVLRHTHKQWNTRGKRPFHRLNIDEVDSVTFIENTKFAMLSEKTANMDVPTFILMCIWHKLHDLAQEKQYKKIKAYDTERKKSISEEIKTYIQSLTFEANAIIKIPLYLQSFVQSQLEAWIGSAIDAYYHYKRNTHYTVETEKNLPIIAPTNLDTGIRQRGMSLNDGMQQFLQMKEGLPVETITLMMTASTNRGHIGLYHGNVVGISGTLSGPTFQKLMGDIYDADIVTIPRFAQNRLTILPGQLKKDSDEWAEAIIEKAISEASIEHGHGRVVVVTCKTIEKTQLLYDMLTQRFQHGRVIKYDDNRGNQGQFLEMEHGGNTIVVATTLAGRGMDLKISTDVCRRGGIFQLNTFLADDPHTETQIFGRAGRGGEPGSAQVIANWEDVKEQLHLKDSQYAKFKNDFNKLIKLRNDIMDSRLEYIKQFEMPWIKNVNDIFSSYLELKNELNDIDKRDREKHYFGSFYEDIKIKVKHQAVEERFGIWFQLCQAETKKNDLIKQEFAQFKAEILRSYDHDIAKPDWQTFDQRSDHNKDSDELSRPLLIQNPAHYMQLGHELLTKADSILQMPVASKLYENAIIAYKAAGKIDPMFAELAYYHRALAIIQLGKKDFATFANKMYGQRRLEKQEKVLKKNYKKQAIAKLNKAKNIIEVTLKQYQPDMLDAIKSINPQLFFQIDANIKSKKLILASINNALSEILSSQRRMDIEVKTVNGSAFIEHVGKKKIINQLKSADEHDLSVSFHDFRTYEDITTNSQLENSLDKIPQHASLKISFDSERFEDGMTQCRLLLPINRAYKHNKEEVNRTQTEEVQDAATESNSPTSDPLRPIESKPAGPSVDNSIDMIRLLSGNADEQAVNELKQVLAAEAQQAKLARSQPELIGVGDYWDYFTEICMNGMMAGAEWTVEKLEAIRSKYYEFKDWLRDNHLYETMKVGLTIKKLTLVQIKSLLKTLAKDYAAITIPQLKLVLNEVNPSILAWLVHQGYSHNVKYSDFIPTPPLTQNVVIKQIKSVTVTCESHEQLEALLSYLSAEEHKLLMTQPCIALDMNKITQQDADKLLESASSPVELHFVTKDKKYATGLINLATAQQQQAILTVGKLNSDELTKLVNHVDRTKQKLVAEPKPIKNLFEKIGMSAEQMIDQQLNGYHLIYGLKEQNPMPWKSLALLTGLIVLETGACVALLTLTAGAGTNFGLAFAGEALGDLFSIVDVLRSRELSIGDFAFKKALGVALNFSTAGLMPCAKAAQAATPVKTIAKTLIRVSPTHTVAFNTKLLKTVGFHYAEKIIRTVAQQGVGMAGKGFVAAIRPKVKKWLDIELKELFHRSQMTQKLNRIFAYRDCLNRMGYYTSFYLQLHAMMSENQFKYGGLSVKSADERESFYKNFLDIIEQHEKKFSNFMTLLQNHLEFHHGFAEIACHWLASHKLLEPNNFELKWNPQFLAASEQESQNTGGYDLDALLQLGNCPDALLPYKQSLLNLYANYASCLRHDYVQERNELQDHVIDRISTHFMHGVENTVAFGGWVINQAIGCGLKFATRAIKGTVDVDLVEGDDLDINFELSNLAVTVAGGTFQFAYHEKFSEFLALKASDNYQTQQAFIDKKNELYNLLFIGMSSHIRNLISLLIIHAHSKSSKSHKLIKEVVNVLEITEKIFSSCVVRDGSSYQKVINALQDLGYENIDDNYSGKLKLMLKQSMDDFIKLKREEKKMFEDIVGKVVERVDVKDTLDFFKSKDDGEMARLVANGHLSPEAYMGGLILKSFNGVIDIFRINAITRQEGQRGVIAYALAAAEEMSKFRGDLMKVESRRMELVETVVQHQGELIKMIDICSRNLATLIDSYEQRHVRDDAHFLLHNKHLSERIKDSLDGIRKEMDENSNMLNEVGTKISAINAKLDELEDQTPRSESRIERLNEERQFFIAQRNALAEKAASLNISIRQIYEAHDQQIKESDASFYAEVHKGSQTFDASRADLKEVIKYQCKTAGQLGTAIAKVMEANGMPADFFIKTAEIMERSFTSMMDSIERIQNGISSDTKQLVSLTQQAGSAVVGVMKDGVSTVADKISEASTSGTSAPSTPALPAPVSQQPGDKTQPTANPATDTSNSSSQVTGDQNGDSDTSHEQRMPKPPAELPSLGDVGQFASPGRNGSASTSSAPSVAPVLPPSGPK